MASKVKRVLSLLGFGEDEVARGHPEITKDYQKVIANLVGRDDTFAVPIITNRVGFLQTGIPDLSKSIANLTRTGFVAAGGSTSAAFSDIFHFHTFRFYGGILRIDWNIDGTNYDHVYYGEGGYLMKDNDQNIVGVFSTPCRAWGVKLSNDSAATSMIYEFASYQFPEFD